MTCEDVLLFTPPVGCSGLPSTANDLATTIHKNVSSTSVPMDLASAQDRSSRMESLIHSGAHQFQSEPIRPPQMGGRQRSRYGLRGVRVGEASHPGPVAIQETLIVGITNGSGVFFGEGGHCRRFRV